MMTRPTTDNITVCLVSTIVCVVFVVCNVFSPTVAAQSSTDSLIRAIVLNQSTAYYDELALEHLLAAANVSSPPAATWETIIALLNHMNLTSNSTQKSHKLHSTKGDQDKSVETYLRNSMAHTFGISLPLKQSISIGNDSNVTVVKVISNDDLQSAINEFPADFMSDQTRRNGGFLVHILIFVYLSIVLAVICDNYFLKSLEYISQALHLPSDIAGATFMAIGTSAPELFTSVIGVFISDNDIGTGTIVGSAVFNLIAIPSACGFAAYYNLKVMPQINSFPIIRDTIFYVLTIITLILCIKDNQVDWIESITLISLYIVYIIIMYFNAQVSHLIKRSGSSKQSDSSFKMNGRRSSSSSSSSASTTATNGKRSSKSLNRPVELKLDESRPLLYGSEPNVKRLSPPPAYGTTTASNSQPPCVHSRNSSYHTDYPQVMVDQNTLAPPTAGQVDYSRIQLTLNTENGKYKEILSCSAEMDQQLLNTKCAPYLAPYSATGGYSHLSGKSSPVGAPSSGKVTPNCSTDLERSGNGDGSGEDVDIDTDWADNAVFRVLLFPFTVAFLFTLPKPTRFCFVLTFISSICWIACLTYFIVWMVTLVGYTLGIPDTVSGITILAAGTSIPELISSYLIVKRAGLADMAICNSIGSNIFDILFCLGLPWLLKTFVVIVTNGAGIATLAASSIPIQSTALPLTSLTLLLTIGAMIGIFNITRWRLSLQTGVLCLLVYILFVVTSTLLELNV